MFVRELLVAELAVVEVLAEVDVPVHPHVVAGGVVLAAVHADVALLAPRPHWPQHVALLELPGLGRRPDAVQGQDVVAVGVGDVLATILRLDNSRENKKVIFNNVFFLSFLTPSLFSQHS